MSLSLLVVILSLRSARIPTLRFTCNGIRIAYNDCFKIRDPISAGNEVHDRKPSPVSELVFNDGYSVASENKDSNIEV